MTNLTVVRRVRAQRVHRLPLIGVDDKLMRVLLLNNIARAPEATDSLRLRFQVSWRRSAHSNNVACLEHPGR